MCIMGYYFKKSVLDKLSLIIKNQKTIMASNQEMLDLLIEADKQTDEIAKDLADLIANAGVSAEVKAKGDALVARLKSVASTHTPAPVNPPPPGGEE